MVSFRVPSALSWQEFFARSPALVAPELLGWMLGDGVVALRIVETEAYLALEDPASHAYGGQTRRNRSMFGPPGCCYIYRSYGIHLCFNVVCHEEGTAGAVLVRAAEVKEGHSQAALRRGRASDLANGPGRLGQALGLSLQLDGACLAPPTSCEQSPLATTHQAPTWHSRLCLHPPQEPVGKIAKGPRVGISKAIDLPLRFWLADSTCLSPGRARSAQGKKRSDD
jgi:DNA-3-methyladenine glycosylase